jgi:hypothetical protein
MLASLLGTAAYESSWLTRIGRAGQKGLDTRDDPPRGLAFRMSPTRL